MKLTYFTKTEQAILGYLFDNPNIRINTRTLSEKIAFSHTSVRKSLDILENKGLVIQKKTKLQTEAYLNLDERRTIIEKRLYNIRILYESGLIEHIEDLYEMPECIVVFGSFSKGEDNEKSDIDIAIKTSLEERKIELAGYEE
ncbi:MAG: nucleotidyltransferase domain-containing protein, partial [Candidatus Woesearchaeota archaeon]